VRNGSIVDRSILQIRGWMGRKGTVTLILRFTTKESKDNQNQWAPVPQLLTRSYAVKFEAFSKFAFQLLPKMPKDGSRIPKSMGLKLIVQDRSKLA